MGVVKLTDAEWNETISSVKREGGVVGVVIMDGGKEPIQWGLGYDGYIYERGFTSEGDAHKRLSSVMGNWLRSK